MYQHYHHDSHNKLKHKVTIYRHYKNAHTQMRKSSRGEKESGKEMRRGKYKKKIGKGENKIKENLKKKERKKKKKSINNIKINKTEMKK